MSRFFRGFFANDAKFPDSQHETRGRLAFSAPTLCDANQKVTDAAEESILASDVFYPDDDKRKLGLAKSPGVPYPSKMTVGRAKKELRDVIKNVDVTRITERLVVMGIPWKNRSSKAAKRNNAKEVAQFLQERYRGKFMLFDVNGGESDYDSKEFHGQIVKFFEGTGDGCAPCLTFVVPLTRFSAWIHQMSQFCIVMTVCNGVG